MAENTGSNSIEKSGVFGSAWRNLRFVWGDIIRFSKRSDSRGDAKPDALRASIRACLKEKGGEVTARKRAAELAGSYLADAPEERLTFLKILNDELGADADAIDRAIETLRSAGSIEQIETARRQLRNVLEPDRVKLLRKFNTLQSGPRFLVELRGELIELKKKHPELAPLENDLGDLLRSWFDVGFLELRRISWNSPASLLEKLGQYEAVHRVRGWLDIKNRLDIDRRCFAFFHPCMQDEPLIFIQVALVNGLSVQIQELLNEKASVLESDEVDTAIFYSISNAQRGLVGISFGNFLIKQVVDQLRRELPNLKRFATLSPIPGFVDWLKLELQAERIELRPSESKKLKALSVETPPIETLSEAIGSTRWIRDEKLSAALNPILQRLCAHYLIKVKRRDGLRALNPVANFHLSNGARIEQLNWLGDTSAKGLQESAGIMVNYLYRLDRIEGYHERYQSKGKIAVSSSVKGLLSK